MIRATRTDGLRGIEGVLDPSTRQMRWKTSTAMGASFAFLLFLLVGRLICWWVRLLFRLFFLGFRRGISGAFLLGQLFPGFRRRLGNPCLQFLGINLLGSRTKEAPLVNGHRVFQVAPNDFKLLELGSQGLVFLAQPPVFRRQPFRSGRAHRHNLWRAWPLSG
jgi:hypothetical protein